MHTVDLVSSGAREMASTRQSVDQSGSIGTADSATSINGVYQAALTRQRFKAIETVFQSHRSRLNARSDSR